MKSVDIYTQEELSNILRIREGEIKIGENIQLITQISNWENELKASSCEFVLLGIPEDIGVKANYGRGGAHSAWKPSLESFLNQQNNHYLNGKNICLLGTIFVDDLLEKADTLTIKSDADIKKLRQLVVDIDTRVCDVVYKIVKAKKIPIIIGGGHNNAYPIIKGCSLALNKKVNVINCDPHTDFRPLEGRHSGNGFSYAYNEQFIEKYSVFCIHEQYNTDKVLEEFKKNNHNLYFSTYEDIFVREKKSFSEALLNNIGFVKTNYCGVEIDLDAITNVPSSAKTSSGLSPIQARQFVYKTANTLDTLYFHIAEGAPILSHIKADNKTGKLISYLISDFIKGVNDKKF